MARSAEWRCLHCNQSSPMLAYPSNLKLSWYRCETCGVFSTNGSGARQYQAFSQHAEEQRFRSWPLVTNAVEHFSRPIESWLEFEPMSLGVASVAHEEGFDVTVVTSNQQAHEECSKVEIRSRYREYYTLDNGLDDYDLAIPDRSIDVVSLHNMLSAVLHPQELLERLRDSLAPGGGFVVSESLRDISTWVFQTELKDNGAPTITPWDDEWRVWFFTRNELLQILTDSGFHLVHTHPSVRSPGGWDVFCVG